MIRSEKGKGCLLKAACCDQLCLNYKTCFCYRGDHFSSSYHRELDRISSSYRFRRDKMMHLAFASHGAMCSFFAFQSLIGVALLKRTYKAFVDREYLEPVGSADIAGTACAISYVLQTCLSVLLGGYVAGSTEAVGMLIAHLRKAMKGTDIGLQKSSYSTRGLWVQSQQSGSGPRSSGIRCGLAASSA